MDKYKINVCELDKDSETIEQPDDIKIKLKPHQLTLLYKCIEFENNRIKLKNYKTIREKYINLQDNDYIKTHVGILGDKVGSGKSYVILSLIMKNKDINYSQIETFGHNKVFLNISTQVENYKTNLLVVPHNLFYQWCAYIKNIIDDDKITYKLISQKKNLQEFINDAKKLNKYNLILVTDTNFKQITNIINLNNIKINRVIFDEIDSLKIPSNKNISCKFYWFLTASYENLLYPKGYQYYDNRVNMVVKKATGLSNKGYIKDLFISIMKERYQDFSNLLVIKNKDLYVDKSFNIPEPNQYIIECKDPIETRLLNGIVDANIINCLNADNNIGAISLFNSKQKKTEDNIITIVIEKYMADISNINIQIEAINQIIYNNDEIINLEERTQRIYRLNIKKKIFEEKIINIKNRIENSKICSICYDEEIINKSIVKCCSNIFCFKCINLWLASKNACPLCKKELDTEDLYLIRDTEDLEIEEIIDETITNKEFDKLKNFEILLKNREEKSKFLIFSEFDISFDKIIKILKKNNIKYSFLKGNKYMIQNIINNFKTGELDILLINIYNYGSGMNLECASDIVMFHKFDKSIEHQVIGRGQRFGRKNSLNIHYLLNENEVSII
jgi:hypothetical protein|tara:strand:- start:5822 stop:7675 length:1854 start_codon:yes stop_codon:yes gene_type:complete